MADESGTNQVKGVAVAATLRFLKDRFDEDGVRKALASLDEADAEALSTVIVSAWYPLPLLLRLMRRAEALFGSRLPQLYREMGRASADYSLTSIYKAFFRLGSPQFIISRGTRVFSRYYQRGSLTVTESGSGFANAELRDLRDGTPEYCERIHGWIERMLELCGARDVRVAHVACVHGGGTVCRFEGRWK